MIKDKGIRIKDYQYINEEARIVEFNAKTFIIIGRENDSNEIFKAGIRKYYGLQITSNVNQAEREENDIIIELNSSKQFVVKCNQLFELNIDMDDIFKNKLKFINDIQISAKLINHCIIRVEELFRKGELYNFVEIHEDILIPKAPKSTQYFDLIT